MKRANIVRLSILIAAAVILTVVFVLLKKKADDPAEEEKIKYLTVTTIDVNRVDRISIQNEYYSGVFTKQGDSWNCESDILSQKVIWQIPDNLLSNLRAIAKVDNPAADSEYGLDNPSAVLEAYAGEERLVRIELGDKVPTKTYYYCRFNGDKTVYTVSASYASLMVRERAYYTETISMPKIPDIKNVQEVILTGDLFPAFHAVKDTENPYDYSGAGLFPWRFEEPYRASWDADVINGPWMDQLEWYINPYAEEIRRVKPDEYAQYGLVNPKATLTVRYSDDTETESMSYTLMVGDQDPETGNYYARLQGVDAVLVMTQLRIRNMCEFDVFSSTYHSIVYPGIQVVSKVTAKAGDLTMVFTHERTEAEEDVYYLNGTQIVGKDALAWAQAVMAMKTSGFRQNDTPTVEPVLTFEIEPFDPSKNKPITVRIYDDPSGNDIVERRGVCDCTMDSRLVDEFIRYMEEVKGGQ